MMKYEDLKKKRRQKQLLIAPLFLIILIGGWRYPLLGFFIPLCMLLGIGIGFWQGRKWCDCLCPRGSFYDALVGPLSLQKEIPGLFKNVSFRISIIFLMMAIMAINLSRIWPNLHKVGMFFVIMLTATTTLGVLLARIIHPRSWCSFCPIGTIIHMLARNRYPLKINSDVCVECNLCAKACPMQIKPYGFKSQGVQTVKDGDCLKCNLCIAVCPQKALRR